MADPFAITSGALAAITATKKTASVIYKFIRDCKDARVDLAQITRELAELELILELIRDEENTAATKSLPNVLQAQVLALLTSCTATIQQIDRIIAKCRRTSSGPLRWTVHEKDIVAALKGSLEAFKTGLSLVLETTNLSMILEVDNSTEVIQDSVCQIKRNPSEILDEIHNLRNQLPPSSSSDTERIRLEQCLDSLTHYAESIAAGGKARKFSDPTSSPAGVSILEKRDDEAVKCSPPRREPPPPKLHPGVPPVRPFSPHPPRRDPPPPQTHLAVPPIRPFSPPLQTHAGLSPIRPFSPHPQASNFDKLDEYDHNWRESLGNFLSKHGFTDDHIKENQDFIVEFLKYQGP